MLFSIALSLCRGFLAQTQCGDIFIACLLLKGSRGTDPPSQIRFHSVVSSQPLVSFKNSMSSLIILVNNMSLRTHSNVTFEKSWSESSIWLKSAPTVVCAIPKEAVRNYEKRRRV